MSNLKDFATGVVVVAPSPTDSGTTLTLQSGEGARMPAVPFTAVAHPAGVYPTLDNAEKITVTNVTSNTLTFTRAGGETTAQDIETGWIISNSLFRADVPQDASEVPVDQTNLNSFVGTNVQEIIDFADVGFTNARSTGWGTGGDLTDLGSGVARFSAGAGSIIDNPDYVQLAWIQTDIDLSATDGIYYIYVDANGDVLSTSTAPDNADYRTEVWLWRVSIRGGEIVGTLPIAQPIQQTAPQIHDAFTAVGDKKEGLVLAPVTTNLTFAYGAGTIYSPGVNVFTDSKDPHRISIPAQSPVTFQHVDQDNDRSADTTVLDVANYDNGGTLTAIPGSGSRAQIFTVFLSPFSKNVRVVRGQEFYGNVGAAFTALQSGTYDPIIPDQILTATNLIGWIIAEKGASDLTDGDQVFVTSSRDGTIGGSVATSGAAALLVNNNLSDLNNAATARTNLGVEIGSDVQAYSLILQNTTASFLTAQETKINHISVTQAVDLDQMESDIAALANGMVYKGDWDASSGSFPGSGSAQTGWFYYVTVGGTVDGVTFAAGDNIVATTDNASATVYASNWSKHDQTDAVQSVAGKTGAVTLVKSDITDLNAYEVGGTDVAVADGGTGASTASGARTNLGLGTLATLNNVNNGNWSGTDLSVLNGGTGVSTHTSGNYLKGNGTGAIVSETIAALTSSVAAILVPQILPVGSYYLNETNSANPSSFLPGMSGTTWVAVVDKFIVARGSTYTSTGGNASHSHPLSDNGQAKISQSSALVFSDRVASSSWNISHASNGASAGGASGSQTVGSGLIGNTDSTSNVPPYQATYIWKRTA